MSTVRRLMAKIRFIKTKCCNCEKEMELKQFAVKVFYSINSDSKTIPLDFSKNNRDIGKFIFMLAGKCECGSMTFVDFSPEELICEAQDIKEIADENGLEEGDIELSQDEVRAQELTM